MTRDRWLLVVAYVLLVGAVAWTTTTTLRALDRIEEDVCATAEIAVGTSVFNIDIYGDQQGVDEEAAEFALEALVTIAEAVADRCGLIFLDEIELPEP